MPLLTRPADPDLLQRPVLAAGVFVFSALTALGLSAVLALAAPAEAQARSRHSVEHNADGSTGPQTGVAHTGVARSGPNGAVLRGRTAATDGQGNASVTSRGVAAGAQGGVATRQGSTTRSADGSVTQARTSTATSAATGNSVQAQSSYSQASGLSRSFTCYDASGTTMACPVRP